MKSAVFVVVIVGLLAVQTHSQEAAPAAAAPAGAPSAPAIPGLVLSFEISNYNFDDLAQDCPEPIYVGRKRHGSVRKAKTEPTEAPAARFNPFKAIGKAVSMTQESSWPQWRREALITNCVGEVVKDTIKMSLLKIIGKGLKNASSAPGAPGAAAPAAVAMLAKAHGLTSAAPAAAVAASPAAAQANATDEPPVDVHVKLFPGQMKRIKHSATAEGNTIQANVTVTGKEDVLAAVDAALKAAQLDRELMLVVADDLYNTGGIHPFITDVTMGPTQVQQWSDGICQKHMSTVVRRFTMAYTRRLVPAALFNECTNFMPMVSFSDDGVITTTDREKCQAATTKFAQKWNFGKGKKGAAAPAAAAAPGAAAGPAAAATMDYAEFCTDICEMKFGEGAQQCHVAANVASPAQ